MALISFLLNFPPVGLQLFNIFNLSSFLLFVQVSSYHSHSPISSAVKREWENPIHIVVSLLSLSHTHTHTHARTHARTRAHTHTHLTLSYLSPSVYALLLHIFLSLWTIPPISCCSSNFHLSSLLLLNLNIVHPFLKYVNLHEIDQNSAISQFFFSVSHVTCHLIVLYHLHK